MWPTERTRNKNCDDDEWIPADPNPNGPIMNNPHPSAVQLSVKFESIALPVFFPNYIPPKLLLDYADPKCVCIYVRFYNARSKNGCIFI